MAITQSRIALSAGQATLLAPEKTTVFVQPVDVAPFLGNGGVRPDEGLQLAGGQILKIKLGPGENLYGVSAVAGSVDVLIQG